MTHDIQVIADGVEYQLIKKQEHQANDPINFPFTKKDMEHHMFTLDSVLDSLKKDGLEMRGIYLSLEKMRKDFQHRIDKTIKRGNWK